MYQSHIFVLTFIRIQLRCIKWDLWFYIIQWLSSSSSAFPLHINVSRKCHPILFAPITSESPFLFLTEIWSIGLKTQENQSQFPSRAAVQTKCQQSNSLTPGGHGIYQVASLYKFDLPLCCRSPGSGTMSIEPRSHSSPASYAGWNPWLDYNSDGETELYVCNTKPIKDIILVTDRVKDILVTDRIKDIPFTRITYYWVKKSCMVTKNGLYMHIDFQSFKHILIFPSIIFQVVLCVGS